MNKIRYLGIVLFLILYAGEAFGQKMTVSTNILGYLDLGTLNAGISYAVGRHWSIDASAAYNPWTFNKGKPQKQFQHRRQSYSAGARFWPWHVYSGWWIMGEMQYQEYNYGGLFTDRTEEGDCLGIGLSAGYTYMLHPDVNIEFGIGLWGGAKRYTAYTCPACGLTTSSGTKAFILPDNIMIGIVYVF